MISFWLEIVGSLLVGFGLGAWGIEVKNGEVKKKIGDTAKKIGKLGPVGGVERPDAHKLDKWRNPKKYEAEEEMIKAFKNDGTLPKIKE